MKINFHKNKSNYIFKSAQMIMDKFNGQVPQTMTELVQLPGVARKTANVVLGDALGKNEGLIVDTHIKRLAQQLGLTQHTDPVKIEQDLMKIVPQRDWIRFSHLLTLYGRYKCPARKPCQDCEILGDLCN
jgi:endonuclease-3